MKEAELKSTVTEYLNIKQKQGCLLWLRLNAGKFLVGKYRIHLCPPGTSDLLIVQDGKAIFVELKGSKGALTLPQREFGQQVQDQGCRYVVVKELEDLSKVVE